MRQVLIRARNLLRRPAPGLSAGLLALGGSALVFLPLFGVPGLELGLALSIGVGLLGGGLGVASVHQERRLLTSQEAGPPPPPREGASLRLAWSALAPALLVNLAVLVPPFLAATLYAWLGTQCDPFALVAFYPLLAVPSAGLASAVGVFSGFATQRAGRGVALYLGLVAVSLCVTVAPIVFGPQVFAFNPFLGYLPGPIYDEVLSVSPALLWFRVETLLLLVGVHALTVECLDTTRARLGRPRPRGGALVLLGLVFGAVLLLEVNAPALGLRMTDATLRERLGGERQTEHFDFIYPRGMPREDVERWARDLEFRHAQLAGFLGGAPEGRIRVWLYRTDEEKQRLVGAGRTQYAKPWRLELHINGRDYPHPTLKHELAHVMAAPWGSGPFRVTTRFGLWPLMGVIEGMAVAADNPVQGELTLDEWAAGMRRQQLAPDVRKLVGPEGFYQSAPARAYTLVGSFLRYLADTHGAEKLRALYAHADFQAAYGRSLDALATEWERHLDALPLDEATVSRAFQRFRTGSLFARACAREVARLQDEARQLLASEPERALTVYERAARLQPQEPSFLLGQAQALERLERPDEAAAVLERLAGTVKEQPAMRAEVALAQADVAARSGRTGPARAFLDEVLSLTPSPEVTRTAQVKLAALDSPVRDALQGYFQEEAEELRLLRLSTALQTAPQDVYLHYLLGRRLVQVGAPRLALGHLTRAIEGQPPDAIRREARRLQIQAAYLGGDCGGVRHLAGSAPGDTTAQRALSAEWLERCEFDTRRFGGPLVPRDAFR
ncbi:tetratricopeptide repeat protein [Archangium primigenium]|uniref:tetratricopeptide repeat protein n=1 Tax=[Archangium] primigenium TaxID=2792470 RepID=UPI00195D1A35|nr:tetratricopeptide repeat protein [Archangium primigenium]MBM7114759.1 tetratricopeptide repeat protein [Archangium primigenium]